MTRNSPLAVLAAIRPFYGFSGGIPMHMKSGMAVVAVLAACLAVSHPVFTAHVAAQAAQPGAAKESDEAAIKTTLTAQTEAWNRGDVESFMQSYEDSPETTFIGTTSIRKGFRPILARYKENYSTREQMGTLTFKDLDVRLLPSASGSVEYAIVTGRFHLERTAKGAATKDDGIFSLVWHKSAGKWKIVLDHTS
jgi:ketosteroid isomerase-like protein